MEYFTKNKEYLKYEKYPDCMETGLILSILKKLGCKAVIAHNVDEKRFLFLFKDIEDKEREKYIEYEDIKNVQNALRIIIDIYYSFKKL